MEAATSTSRSNQQERLLNMMERRIFGCAGADQHCPLLHSRVKNPGLLSLGWKPCRGRRKMKEREHRQISATVNSLPHLVQNWLDLGCLDTPVHSKTGALRHSCKMHFELCFVIPVAPGMTSWHGRNNTCLFSVHDRIC